MGMNCAIITYNGKAFVGFTGDVNAIPDLKLLPKFLNESFRQLLKSAVPLKRRKAPRPSKRKKGASQIQDSEAATASPVPETLQENATEIAGEPEFAQTAVAD
jgi:hypothetical protein